MACAVTTEKMSRVPTENEFFGSHVVNGEYDAGASVSLVSGVIVNVRVFPFFLLLHAMMICHWLCVRGISTRFEMIREISWRTRFPGDAC